MSLPGVTWALEKPTVSGNLADRMVTAIAVGVYSPGERLPPERQLAVTLGVSRTTVREALRQVAGLGLIESRRGGNGGNFITAASWEEIAPETARHTLEVELPRLSDLFDFRCLVEGMIARTAAERRTDDDITELNAALVAFREAQGMIEARQLDRRLHGLINMTARNPYLMTLSGQLTVAATLGFGAEPYLDEFFSQAVIEHQELVDRIIDGSPDAAGRAAEDHYSLTLKTMMARLSR